jgi:hypothetical protein
VTERTCGECYRCCVAFGIPELNKYQDQTCRHLHGRNPTARGSIYGDRPACCKSYQCLWREGFFNDEDRPDKSGVIAHFSPLDSGRIELDLTIDDRDKAVSATINRIHEWVADKPFHQIMYRRIGSNVAMIQTRDGGIAAYSYVADVETGIRFIARLS